MSTSLPLTACSPAAERRLPPPAYAAMPRPRPDAPLDLDLPVRHRLRTFDGRVQFLGQALRGTTMLFTPLFAMWIGCHLRRVERAPDTEHVLTAPQAHLLDLDPGTVVTRREGWLAPHTDRHGRLHLASITSLVHAPRLAADEDAVAALQDGHEPLGALVAGRRTTLQANRLPASPAPTHHASAPGKPTRAVAPEDPWTPAPLLDDCGDVPVMRSVGFLHRDGVPFALAIETVYEVAFERMDVAAVETVLAPLVLGGGVA